MNKIKLCNGSDWFSDARFGMFIHWGIYSQAAGKWKGKEYDGLGEWIIQFANISGQEYGEFAKKFNPVMFDARQWVALAKGAGMKYIVITAKHADGFAMYDSKVSDYNIIKQTKCDRDILKELACECRKQDIKFCIYYSQAVDYEHPGGHKEAERPTHYNAALFQEYLDQKVKPQLKELLTGYGPIGLIWFDNPLNMTKQQSLSLKKLVKQYQPDCLVSGRIGNSLGDYESTGDNQPPGCKSKKMSEVPGTMNDTWGYKANDRNWKSAEELLTLLVDLASKGVNYLLNIGPLGTGKIPAATVKRFEAIAKWMEMNKQAIYGTSPSPFVQQFDWGRVTVRDNIMYLFLLNWPGEYLSIRGLKSPVNKAYLLSDRKIKLSFQQQKKFDSIRIKLPAKKTGEVIPVIALELEGAVKVSRNIIQQETDTLRLLPDCAHFHNISSDKSKIYVGDSGAIENWVSTKDFVSWRFELIEPGEYEISVLTTSLQHNAKWKGGHEVLLLFDNCKYDGTIKGEINPNDSANRYYRCAGSKIATVRIDKPGVYDLQLRARKINKLSPGALSVSSLQISKCN